jgi:hypothetical protein
LYLKKFTKKGCPFCAIEFLNAIESEEINIEDHPVLLEFKDVFLEEVPRIPYKIYLDFSIDLVPREELTSKVPYMMSTLELVELKVKLKEMMDQWYIKVIVSP